MEAPVTMVVNEDANDLVPQLAPEKRGIHGAEL